jgi:hypothetical protein
MSVRTKMIRKWRKNVLRNVTGAKVKVWNRDEDNGRLLPKSERGYSVDFVCNGHKCTCIDDSWYFLWQSADGLVKNCMNGDLFYGTCDELFRD